MAMLEICLLGGFELARDGRILDPLPLRAARSLFAYLVLNRDRPHTRDLLAGIFWPDFDESRARRRLSQALWQIQHSIGEEEGDRYIVGTPDTVRFNPDAEFRLDVDRFERLLDRDEPESIDKAIDVYRGDLLAGFYDDWVFPEQDRLRSRFIAALERLVDIDIAKGDHEGALVHARRLAQEDEFDEEAHRRVMRIAVLLGRHNEAIRQFEECRRILAEELGTKPSAETLQLYEATIADRDAGGRAIAPDDESPLFEDADSAPFVGRDGERSRFAALLDAAHDGRGGVILLEGESGVGKTRLLAEVVRDAEWRGMDILSGRSNPTGGRPFAPLAEALGDISSLRARQVASRLDPEWRAVLALLAPALAGDGEVPELPRLRRTDEQSRMRAALAMAFREVAAVNPTLVVLEDVHWADDDTIQALNQIAGLVADDKIVFAVSYRHGEARERSDVWNLLRELDRQPHCERVSLAPYSPAQTEELIRRSLGRSEVSGEFSERVHRETGGIPLFIVETLRALYERDDLGAADMEAEEAPPSRDALPLTPTIHALIRHRLDALSSSAQRTLELVSAHDGTLTLAEIVHASAMEDPAALEAVDDLVRRRLVSVRSGSYTTGHELLRRVVYDDLGLSRQLDLHRRVALAIEQHRPEEVELLAHHFLTARMPERAAEFLELAGTRALELHAYDTAALHLERAVETLDDIAAPADRRFSVAESLQEVLDVLGRRDEQEHALRRMERYAQGSQRADALTAKAWWLAHQDRFDEAVETARGAHLLADRENDPDRRVAALTALGMIACFVGKASEGVDYLEQAADLDGIDRRREADARNALGQNLLDLQRFGQAEAQLLAALSIYSDLGDARGEAEVLGMLATLRMERGEPESAEADYLRAIETSQQIGYRHGEAVYQMNLAILYAITNRIGEALDLFQAAALSYSILGNTRGRALVQANAAWLWHSVVGDDDRAERLATEAMDIYVSIGDERGQAQGLVILGSIAGRQGDEDAAIERFDAAIAKSERLEDAWLTAQMLREFAAFELETGRYESGRKHAIRAEALCKEYGMNDLVVAVRAIAARLHFRLNDLFTAKEYADKAIREIRPGIEFPHLPPLAMAEILQAEGDDKAASQHLARANDALSGVLSGLTSTQREMSMQRIPTHRTVRDWWRAVKPEIEEVMLPRSETPLGRAIKDEDLVSVRWTLHHPSDADAGDRISQRQTRLLRLVEEASAQDAAPTVDHLAEALRASSATVRRDLAALREAGHEVATRGNR